ncbi:MAG: acyl-CoA reductase [Flavobacteriales bacterium]|nr:acyl-CoA reductase [Flavobacteriales bacterium]MDW8410682.1 acyl-CoA reductase [Flavobacteriales bacterium]
MANKGFTARLESFAKLGKDLDELLQATHEENTLAEAIAQALEQNPWFEKRWIRQALHAIAYFLKEEHLEKWSHLTPATYRNKERHSTVALVLPGNIPAVGFADIFYVLMSGCKALLKFSAQDRALPQFLLQRLLKLNPALWEDSFLEADLPLKNFDAILITGSSATATHLDYYFRKYPRIVRGHRQSVAVLTGQESETDLEGLALDIVCYFGRGCRNVAYLLVPEGYEWSGLQRALEPYSELLNHHRYGNNYDYRKAVLHLSRIPFIEAGPCLLVRSEKVHAPVSMVHYMTYRTSKEVQSFLEANRQAIQVVVGRVPWLSGTVAPGRAQYPLPWDYADGVDVAAFLASLN